MKSFPQDLIDAFNADDVICICGSGPSVAAGFPSWHRLLELMIEECESQLIGFKHGRELRTLLKRGHLLEVADECSKLLEGQLYRDFFQSIFRDESIKPVKLHELLVQLPFSAILTTNYDNLLERTHIAQARPSGYPLVYTQKNVSQLPRLAGEKRFFIFKMHGDADDIQTIVLTKRDYRDIIHSSDPYRTALGQILATRTALFVGYGLRDHDLNLVLGEQAALFKAYGRRHYAVLPDPGTVLPKSFLEHYNVSVIPYSGKNQHAELPQLFEALLALVKKAPSSSEGEVTRRLMHLVEVESEYCQQLGTHIELNRARYLKTHAFDLLGDKERTLVDESIRFWEEKESTRISLESQLRQAQKMESIGQLAAGVAHDFNNILTIVQGHAGQILKQADLDKKVIEPVKQISLAAERAGQLTRQLLMFSRKQVKQARLVDLNALISNMKRMVRLLLGEGVRFEAQHGADLPLINADPGMMEQIILNLAVNSRDAMPNGGKFLISTAIKDVDFNYVAQRPEARIGRFVCLCVEDTGTGMSKETLGRIFEPFFTTKEIGKGTGLGLATVHGIVKQHEGWIEVGSELGIGTTFNVYLPESKHSTRPAVEAAEVGSLQGSETILLVEDEPALQELEFGILRSHGYKVICASDGHEAVRLWNEAKGEIDLLLTDMIMPGNMSGYELSLLLLKEKPSLKVIYVSGYSPDVLGRSGLDLSDRFIQKPFPPEMLLSSIRTILDTGRPTSL